jgi:hypothetical protein
MQTTGDSVGKGGPTVKVGLVSLWDLVVDLWVI